jgi:hypothetical protein
MIQSLAATKCHAEKMMTKCRSKMKKAKNNEEIEQYNEKIKEFKEQVESTKRNIALMELQGSSTDNSLNNSSGQLNDGPILRLLNDGPLLDLIKYRDPLFLIHALSLPKFEQIQK